MAELRSLAESLGWGSVQTWLQSGNLLFDAEEPDAAVHEARLEQELRRAFGFEIEAIVRGRGAWRDCLAGNPFPDAARSAPSYLMLFVSKRPPVDGAEADIAARLDLPVRRAGDALWVRFREGRSMGNVKLPWDRLIGSPATSRNWRTAAKIASLL